MMISVAEAKQILAHVCEGVSPLSIPLYQAGGLVLAADMYATGAFPAFHQSAMDGYAFRFQDWNPTQPLLIIGVVQAGDGGQNSVGVGKAVRIFTGAAIPDGLDTVVMQEKVCVEGNLLLINDAQLQQGGNVRPKGSEIQQDALALPKYTPLSPAAIGFLAGIGVPEVWVYPLPQIKLVVTGNELVQPGQSLSYGQVYESNSFAIKAVLQQMGIQNVSVTFAKDTVAELKVALEAALQESDIVLVTGGVSVGDYDLVASTLQACGVEKLFHKIKQKPGKPLFAGKKGHQMVFGLPGNPSSVLTCFYEYVVPVIAQMTHATTSIVRKEYRPLSHSFTKKSGLTHFLKGHCTPQNVTLLTAQESYKLSSFATANCLVCLDEHRSEYDAGNIVEVHIFSV